jgi:phosphoribosylanthranilate isomerase
MQVNNISFQIAPNLEAQWLEWMKSKFIPTIQATGCFINHQFYQIDVAADQAPTYTLQLYTNNPETLIKYQDELSLPIMEMLLNTWGDQCFHFITTMRIVN